MGFLDKLSDIVNKCNNEKLISLKFKVRSWDEYTDNISKWQKENTRDQWINAKYSSKKLFQYSWVSDTENIILKPEPENKHSKEAIAVYLGIYKVGYVPNPVNKQYYAKLIKSKEIKADIHGGNFKYIDEYGDLIVDKESNPVIDITILI